MSGFDNHIGVQAQGAPFVWRMTFSKDSGESAVLRAPLAVLLPRRCETDGSSWTVSCCAFLWFTTSTSEADELSFGAAGSELGTFGDRVCLPTGTESVWRMVAYQWYRCGQSAGRVAVCIRLVRGGAVSTQSCQSARSCFVQDMTINDTRSCGRAAGRW